MNYVKVAPFLVPQNKLARLFVLALIFLLSSGIAFAQTATVRLTWDLPTDTTGITEYHIYVRQASSATYGTTFTTVAGASSSSTTLTNISPGSYFFQAKSFDGVNESVASNEYAATAVQASLQGRTTASKLNGIVFSVKAFAVGNTTTPLLTVSATANASGVLTIPSAVGLPATFDLRLKAPGYLAKRISSRGVNDTTALPALLAGDINGNSGVNVLDFSAMTTTWGAPGVGDLDGSGVTNVLDFSLMTLNWNKLDEL